MQPFRAATECEVDRARKRAASCNRAQTSDTEQILEICGCHPNTTPLTRTSPCEVRMRLRHDPWGHRGKRRSPAPGSGRQMEAPLRPRFRQGKEPRFGPAPLAVALGSLRPQEGSQPRGGRLARAVRGRAHRRERELMSSALLLTGKLAIAAVRRRRRSDGAIYAVARIHDSDRGMPRSGPSTQTTSQPLSGSRNSASASRSRVPGRSKSRPPAPSWPIG